MSKSLSILVLLIINNRIGNPFVFPKTFDRKIIHVATSKEPLLFEGLSSQKITTTAEDMPAAQKKMKSNNIRWLIHGIITELFYNIFLRTLNRARTILFTTTQSSEYQKYRQPRKHEIAVVTGATGGIGSQIAHDLAFRGYDVVIAARNLDMGKALVKKIEGELKVTPIKSSSSDSEDDDVDLPAITFIEYHADVPQSAFDMASSITDMKSPLTVLINNAGIMGKSKQLTMRVNLLGPAYLTFALLPLMAKCTKPTTVINVGSSAHLRATCVVDEESTGENASEDDDNKQSWIENLPDIADDNLSTYAQSKMALMQFSTLLRNCLQKSDPPIQVIDAHPGLVWTPLLRNHIGDKAVGTLTKTGLANLIYKSSSEGARAIVSALDYSPPSTASAKEQVYYVNGKPGGYSADESISIDASNQLWKCVLKPEVDGFVELPKGWGLAK